MSVFFKKRSTIIVIMIAKEKAKSLGVSIITLPRDKEWRANRLWGLI
jgi:hypothetical protein